MPNAAYMPAVMSAIDTPARTPRPPGSPVTLIMPLSAWTTRSKRGAVAVGAVLAEPRDRAVDDARLPRARLLVADAEPRDGADAQVLEHHVGALEQPEEDRLAVGVLQIERDALLVAVQVDEVRRLVAIERRAPRARDLAVERLDLDDLRAVVAEHRRRERAGERMGQIQDDEVAERRRHGHSSTMA